MPSPSQRDSSVVGLSSKTNSAARWPRSAAAVANWAASVDLPVPAAPTISVLVPSSRPPPSSASSAGDAAGQPDAAGRLSMLGGDQAREDAQAAALDHVVVVAAAKLRAAILDHAQPAALRAVVRMHLLEADHAVRDALHLQVVVGRRHVVEQHAPCSCGWRRTA